MSRFRKNILVGEEEMDFSFTQLKYPDGIGYFVTVSDKNRNIYSFDLKQAARNEWEITRKERLPEWIINIEQVIIDAVHRGKMKASPDSSAIR
jgi:hypothetical protein